MDRLYEAYAVGSPPALPSPGSSGYPSNGVPFSQAATEPGAHWFWMITEEIRKVLTDAGLTPSAASLQLSSAIQSLIGTNLQNPFAGIAGASTTDIGSLGYNNVHITSTATISSFGSSASTLDPIYVVYFDATCTLVNGSNLRLPGRGSIAVAAGDSLIARYVGSGVWYVLWFGATYAPAKQVFTSIASAATTDIGTINTNVINVTGTTTITSFGSSANTDFPLYIIKFAGNLTVTNGANIQCPGGADLAILAGDYIWANYLGGGVWDIIAYFPNNSTASFTSIASASTTDLGSTRARNVNVTGTTTITSFGSSASTSQPIYFVTFAGSLVLTNGANLNLPFNQNITTAAGDYLIARYKGSGAWDVIGYFQNSSYQLQEIAPVLLLSKAGGTPRDPGAGFDGNNMVIVSNTANWVTYNLSSHIPASANAKVAKISFWGTTGQDTIAFKARKSSGAPELEKFQISATGGGDQATCRIEVEVPLTPSYTCDIIMVGGGSGGAGAYNWSGCLVGYK